MARISKYRNRETYLDGMIFDSKKEAQRWAELKLMEKAGEIINLQRQRKFELVPAIKGPRGGTAQRAVSYIADFEYFEKKGSVWVRVVEDVKSPATRTQAYIIKKKLMLWRHGIEIREV